MKYFLLSFALFFPLHFIFDRFSLENWNKSISLKIKTILSSSFHQVDKHLNQFLVLLGKHPLLSGLYEKSVGLQKGYTLHKHTFLVLKQYMKYFAPHNLPKEMSHSSFLLLLALHDIGKPQAVKEKKKFFQHKYTCSIIKKLSKDLILINLPKTLSLVSSDVMGNFIKGKKSLEDTEKHIYFLADQANLSAKNFLSLLTTYYQADSGAYTKDAGGLPALDHLYKKKANQFLFNRLKERIEFSSNKEKLMKQLEKNFSS